MLRVYITFFIFAFHASLHAAQLIALLFIDSLSSDIGSACLGDLENWKKELQVISQTTSLKLQMTVLTGDALRVQRINEVVDSVKPTKEDVILLYFSGHGYRLEKEESPWPHLYAPKDSRGVSFDALVARLSKAKPRFLLAISDCCNSSPLMKSATFSKGANFGDKGVGYRKLFLEERGTLQITSAQPSSRSWVYKEFSLFTHAFLYYLSYETSQGSLASWKKILENTSMMIKQYQEPYFRFLNHH